MSQKPYIFISFISEDREIADQVRHSLDAFIKKSGSDWIVYQYTDPDQMYSGPNQAARLAHKIKTDITNIVFVVSKASLRKQKSLVNIEINAAKERKRELVNADYLFAHAVTADDDLDIDSFPAHLELFDHPLLLSDIGSVWTSIQKTLDQFGIDSVPQEVRLTTSSGESLALSKSSQKLLGRFLAKAKADFFDGLMPQFLLCLFGERQEHRIPHNLDEYLDVEDPRKIDFDAVSQYLTRRRMRDLTIRAEGIYFGAKSRKDLSDSFRGRTFLDPTDKWIQVGIVDNSSPTFSKILLAVDEYLGGIEATGDLSDEWAHLVNTDGHALFQEIESGFNTTAIVLPGRIVPDNRNRDIIGLVLPLDETAEAMKRWPSVKRKEFHSALQTVLTPVLQSIVIEHAKRRLASPTVRRPDVQRICMDAALTLSGTDWGCIKTKCIGPDGSIGNVAAECVFHCPRFYDEGVFPEADGAIGSVLESGRSKVIRLGQDMQVGQKAHPAKAAYVCVLSPNKEHYKYSNTSSPRLQPSAIVLQHVNHSYLDAHQSLYSASVEKIGKMYVDAVDSLVHREAFESISLLRYDLKQGKTVTLSSIAREIIHDTFADSDVAWALYSWDHEIDDKKTLLASSSNEAGASLRALIGMDLDKATFNSSLLYFSSNSRHPLVVHEVELGFAPFRVYRRREHNLAFRAFFSDRASKEQAEADSSILLGKSIEIVKLFSRAPFSALTVPLVSADGLPVGVFVVARKPAWEDATIDRVCEHANIARIARILYQLRHRSDVASIISDGTNVD